MYEETELDKLFKACDAEKRFGHSDMESTMRYLKPSRSQQVREKVNEIFA